MTETSYNHLVLTWTKPEDKPGIQDEARGYFVEIRQADCIEWSCCNSTPIIMTSFSVKGLKSMDMYWVRVIAINDGGESEPEELPNYVLAMPSPGMSTSLRYVRFCWLVAAKNYYFKENKTFYQKNPLFLGRIQHVCDDLSLLISFCSFQLRTLINYNMVQTFFFIVFYLFIYFVTTTVRPRFTNNKMKSFFVVRAGNSVRITVNFEVRIIFQF